jgi:zinc transport system ATP-binding protein
MAPTAVPSESLGGPAARAPGAAPRLAVYDVVFGYRSERVLDGVTLEIFPGDFLAVIGPNGGGKTTLLKILLGLLRPWSGRVEYRFSSSSKPGGKIGYVPQFSTFDKDFPLRVSDVVLMGCLGKVSLLRPYPKACRLAAQETLERLKLRHLAKAHVSELSGGELQRLLIARAIVGDPEVLFLDEPTASIDSDSREILRTLLAELNQRMPIVVVTHDVTAVAQSVNRIACVDRKLYAHEGNAVTPEMLEEVYGCPVDLDSHGAAHRVLHGR